MGKTRKSFIKRTAGFFAFAGKLSRKEAGALLLTLAAALAVWLFTAENYRREAVKDISRSLETINSYKIKEISSWRGEHLREALRLSRHPFLGEIVSEEMAKPGSRRAQLTAWVKDHAEQKRYCSMAFLSPKGAVIAGTPGYLPGREKQFTEAFAQARKGSALLTDLYLAADGHPRMTMFSPISPGGRRGRTLCVLAVNIDPEKEFYPLLKAAPLFFARAETQLVRKEGEKVLFLNEQDYSRDSALKLARPLADGQLPSAAALGGRAGFFEGVDYRGVKVFSAIGQVEGSGWAVITKIDRKTALASVRDRQLLALTLIMPLALLLYGLLLLYFRHRLRTGQQQAEEKLARINERLVLAARAGRFGVWDWNVPGNRLVWDDRMLELYGVKKEDFPGGYEIWLTRVHPDDKARCEEEARQALSGKKEYDIEFRVVRPDGTIRYIKASAELFRGADGRPLRMLGINLDITERRLAEVALRESEAYIRTVLDNLPIGIAVNSVDPEVKFSYANDLFPEIYRTTKEALARPDGFWEAVYQEPKQREELRKKVLEDCASGDPARMRWEDVPVARRGEATTYITGQNIPLPGGKLMVSTVLDVTERKLAEEKLEEAAKNWLDTFDAIDDIVWMMDAESRIIRVNKATHKTFSLPDGELIGRRCWEVVHGSSQPIPECPALPAKKNMRRETAEYALNGKIYEIIVDPMVGADGKYAGAVHILRDITVRKQAELEKERLNKNLVEKKQELENFLYITTHDLRSPLVNIQGFSQNLERYLAELRRLLSALALPPETGRELEKLTGRSIPEALKFVLESSRKMDGLISSLLKVSRIGRVEMKPETVGMNALIKNIMESLFYHLEDAGGKVNCGSLPPCRADLAAVGQIFTNLLDNAVKYRQKGRPLVVNVTGEVKENMALYTVADNGAGIPAADLDRVWSVFYRGGSARASGQNGEGIGLHMVKLMIEKNGGGITVDSKEGEGTVFSVRLPAAGEGA
ncbi:MAG: PAS domain S-box protein [Elusimicrobiota bacterium]